MKYLVDQQQHRHIAAQWWDDVARKVNYSTNNEEGTSTYRHNWASLKTLSSGKLLSFFIRAKSTVNAMIFHVPQVKLMIALAWENQISSWCDAKIFDGHTLTATPRAVRFLYIECKITMVTGTRGKVTLVESHPPQNHYVNCNPVNCHPQKKAPMEINKQPIFLIFTFIKKYYTYISKFNLKYYIEVLVTYIKIKGKA